MFIEYFLNYENKRLAGIINSNHIIRISLSDGNLQIINAVETLTFYTHDLLHATVIYDGFKDVIKGRFAVAFPGIGYIERL